MIRHFVLTLSGAAQQLTEALPAGQQAVNGPFDTPIRAIVLQPFGTNAAAIYCGGKESGAPTSSSYGWRLEAASAGVPPAPFVLGEFSNAPMRLSDFQVLGTLNEKLTIAIVT